MKDASLALQEAAAGLLYPSESDAPFEPFCWTGQSFPNAEEAVKAHMEAGEPLEAVKFETFFQELAETDDAAGFERLKARLEGILSQPAVVRSGAVKVHIFLIGKDAEGNWAGLRTTSIET